MPDDDSSDKDKKATENVLTQKFGPLPLFVWIAIAAGALGAIFIIKKNAAGGGSSSVQSVPVATGVAGGAAPSGDTGSTSGPDLSSYITTKSEQTDITGLTAQIQSLSDSITSQLKTITANESTLGTGLANVNSLVSGFQNDISGLGSQLNSLSGQVASSNANEAALQQQVNEENATIQNLVGSVIPNLESQIHANTQA